MPQPYTASGRTTLFLNTGSRIRKIRLPVALVTPLTTPVQFVLINPVAGNVVGSTALQNLWTLMRGFYNAPINPPSYLIEQNFSGIFSPIESGALTGVGIGAPAGNLNFVTTFSFRDVVGHKLKWLMPESGIFGLIHAGIGSLSGITLTLVQSFLSTVNPSDIGNWGRSRGGIQIKTFSFLTGSVNKRYRRQAGLV